jgi:hypothetical protein
VTPTVRLNLSSYEHGSDFLSGSTAGATYDFEVKPNSEYYCWVQVYTWAHAEHDGYATGSIEITVPMLFLEAVKTG